MPENKTPLPRSPSKVSCKISGPLSSCVLMTSRAPSLQRGGIRCDYQLLWPAVLTRAIEGTRQLRAFVGEQNYISPVISVDLRFQVKLFCSGVQIQTTFEPNCLEISRKLINITTSG